MNDTLNQETEIIVPSPIAAAENSPRPWGFWMTTGLSLAVGAVFFVAQAAVMIAFIFVAVIRDPQIDVADYTYSLANNGLHLALAIIASAPICTGIVILFAWLRRGITVRDYLGLKKPSKKDAVIWLAVFALFIAAVMVISYIFQRPMDPFMLDAYRTAYFLPLLILAVVIAAPVFEEIFVRGFILPGIQHSRLGPVAAVIITSLGWTAIHLQYGAFDLAVIFAGGVLLGIVRLKTDSTYLLIVMHAAINLLATIEVAIYIHTSG